MHRVSLEIDLLAKLFLDFLLHLVLYDTLATPGVLHPLGVTLAAIVRHHALEPAHLDLSGNQLLDEGNINSYSIGNAAGANFMGVKLRDNMNLFLSGMNTLPGVTVRW